MQAFKLPLEIKSRSNLEFLVILEAMLSDVGVDGPERSLVAFGFVLLHVVFDYFFGRENERLDNSVL